MLLVSHVIHIYTCMQEYRKLYGEYYFKVVAPPSDVTAVIILLLVIASGIHYVILQQQKKDYNAKLIKLCVENKGPTQGGSVEVRDRREIYMKMSHMCVCM
jgi:hypothetical protein